MNRYSVLVDTFMSTTFSLLFPLSVMAADNDLYHLDKKEPSTLEENLSRHKPWSVGFFGVSHHDTKGAPNTMNERNPMFSLSYTFEEKLLCAHPFVEGGRIFKNSKRGATDFVSVGGECSYAIHQRLVTGIGFGLTRVRYEDPTKALSGKPTGKEGTLPLVYVRIGFIANKNDEFGIRVIPLGDKVTFAHFYYKWSFQ